MKTAVSTRACAGSEMNHRCNQSHEIRHVAARLLASGLTVRQTAAQLGRHRVTVWRWICAGLDAEVARLLAIARAELVRARVAGIVAGAPAGQAKGEHKHGPGRCPVCGTRIGKTRRE